MTKEEMFEKETGYELSDKVNWIEISMNQSLSENFIREFSDEFVDDFHYCVHSGHKLRY